MTVDAFATPCSTGAPPLHSINPQPEGAIPHDAILYRQRHRIGIMFGRLKDWRRIAMRYDRCAHTFFAAITIAFWRNQ